MMEKSPLEDGDSSSAKRQLEEERRQIEEERKTLSFERKLLEDERRRFEELKQKRQEEEQRKRQEEIKRERGMMVLLENIVSCSGWEEADEIADLIADGSFSEREKRALLLAALNSRSPRQFASDQHQRFNHEMHRLTGINLQGWRSDSYSCYIKQCTMKMRSSVALEIYNNTAHNNVAVGEFLYRNKALRIKPVPITTVVYGAHTTDAALILLSNKLFASAREEYGGVPLLWFGISLLTEKEILQEQQRSEREKERKAGKEKKFVSRALKEAKTKGSGFGPICFELPLDSLLALYAKENDISVSDLSWYCLGTRDHYRFDKRNNKRSAELAHAYLVSYRTVYCHGAKLTPIDRPAVFNLQEDTSGVHPGITSWDHPELAFDVSDSLSLPTDVVVKYRNHLQCLKARKDRSFNCPDLNTRATAAKGDLINAFEQAVVRLATADKK